MKMHFPGDLKEARQHGSYSPKKMDLVTTLLKLEIGSSSVKSIDSLAFALLLAYRQQHNKYALF
jgi:hypothetical protein